MYMNEWMKKALVILFVSCQFAGAYMSGISRFLPDGNVRDGSEMIQETEASEEEDVFELLVATEDTSILRSEEEGEKRCEGLYLMEYQTEEEYEEAYRYYEEKADFVEENFDFYAAREAVPVIPRWDGETEWDGFLGYEYAEENIEKANGSIALIDSGADSANVKKHISLISEEAGDENGHGTAMAEIIKTVNPDVSVVSIKVLNRDGRGKIADLYAAIELSIQMEVKQINLSLSGNLIGESRALRKAVDDAIDAGIIVVGAAGNNGESAEGYFPGGIESIIVCGSCDGTGTRRDFSNYGKKVDYYLDTESTSEAAAKMTAILAKYNEAELDEALMKKYGIVKGDCMDEAEGEKGRHSSEQDGIWAARVKEEPDGNRWVQAVSEIDGARFYRDWEGDDAICIMDSASNMAMYAYLDVQPTYETGTELARVLFGATRDYNVKTPSGKDNISNIMRIYFADSRGGDYELYNRDVLKNHLITTDNKNIRNLIQTYRSKEIPEQYKFTVKYLTQDENLNGKPDRGGIGLEDSRYQDFLSWRLEEKTKMYGVIEKVLKMGDTVAPLEGIEFEVFLNHAKAGSWFEIHPILSIKTDANGIAVWKGGGSGSGLGTKSDIDENGIADVEQGYYVREKVNAVTLQNGISVDVEKKYEVPLYYYPDSGVVPDTKTLKNEKKGVRIENIKDEFYLRIEKDSFGKKESFVGIEFVLKDPNKEEFALFIMDESGCIDKEKSFIFPEQISENGGRDNRKVLKSDFVELTEADGKTYIYLHWFMNRNSPYNEESADGSSYGWTLTEIKGNESYAIRPGESGRFTLRPNQMRVLKYSETILSLRDNLREKISMIKKSAAGFEDVLRENSDISLEGTTYSIYRSFDDAKEEKNALGSLVCDKDGKSGFVEVSDYMKKDNQGAFVDTSFYVRESKAGSGYILSEEVYEIKVVPGSKETAFTAEDIPAVFELELEKRGLTDGRNAQFVVRENGKAVLFKRLSDGLYVRTSHEGGQTISPDEKGKLRLIGLQGKKYEITEMQTEAGAELLKSAFQVTFVPEAKYGYLKTVVISFDGKNTEITMKDKENKVSLVVENERGVYLSAGGKGVGGFYAASVSIILLAAAILVVAKKRRKNLLYGMLSLTIVGSFFSGDYSGPGNKIRVVRAEEINDEVNEKTIDEDRECAIHIRYFDDDQNTVPISDAQFVLYKVADLGNMGNMKYLEPELEKEIPDVKGDALGDIGGIAEKVKGICEKYETGDLKKRIRLRNGCQDVTVTSGLYLLMEEEAAPYHFLSEPCLIQIPYIDENKEGEQFWNYERTIYPKSNVFGDLSIQKKVIGSDEDKEKIFSFSVSFLPDGVFLLEKEDGTTEEIKSGYTALLKDGEIIVIRNIPMGTTYKVVEIEANTGGYIATYENAEGVITGKEIQKVVVTNTKQDSPKTGDNMVTRFLYAMVASFAGIVELVWLRRKDDLNEKMES